MAENVQQFKAVLAGCGGITAAWLDAVKNFNDIKIVGLVDIRAEAASALRGKRGLADAVTGDNLASVIDQTGADIVFDCTIPAAHKDVVTTALAKGCHVLGEKPMAENLTQARLMAQAAKDAGKTYAVIQNRRYLPSILRYRDAFRFPQLGSLTTLDADFYLGCHFGGFREQMNHVLLLDMAIHSFDQARFISGKDPVSVYCMDWNPKGSWYKHGASAIAIFEMTDGVVFTYRGSWCATGMSTSWECAWRGVCETGTVLWDGADSVVGKSVDTSRPCSFTSPCVALPVPDAPDLTHQSHAGVIREFLDCLKNGKVPQTVCFDNIKSLAMVEAAIESAEKGCKVKITV